MCEFCERGKPLTIGKTNDYGIAIQYPNKIVAFGYDVHGCGSNGLVKKINYCPICGRKLVEEDITQKDVHNNIVANASDWQKAYLSLQCGGNVEKIKEVEQSMANIINCISKALKSSGVDYLNKLDL